MQTEIKHGRSATDICEAGAGGELHRAILLEELGGAVYAVGEEFGYDDGEPAGELVRLANALRDHLDRISITEDAALTLRRRCMRCSGAGMTTNEPKCVECDGAGYVHADEAEG